MRDSEPPTLPTLAYATGAAPLTFADVRRAVLPALVVLAIGVALPFGIVHWLRIRYGPYAITQWTPNVAQVEFWSCDVPFGGWFALWAIALTISIRRSAIATGRHLSIGVGVLVLFLVGFIFLVMMDGPFP